MRLGVGNQRVVVRTLRLPAIEDPKEMEAAVRFQAQEQIPMPLDQAVLEHQVVGGVPAEEGRRRRSTSSSSPPAATWSPPSSSRFAAPGCEPVGVDLSAFGMIRALAGAGRSPRAAPSGAPAQPSEAVLYCNLGDVDEPRGGARPRLPLHPRLHSRPRGRSPAGSPTERGLSPEHAAQWLIHVGLERPVEEIEGDPETVAEARRALEEGVAGLVDELRLSLDYYGAQEGAVPVERIVLCGPGSAIPGLAGAMEAGLGLPVAVARPPALAELRRRSRRPPDPLLRPGPGGLACAPST